MVVAATTNDELNLLVAELVHSEFGVEHPVVGLQLPPDELGRRSRAWVDLLGTLILLIEVFATLSIAASLLLVYLGGRRDFKTPGGERNHA